MEKIKTKSNDCKYCKKTFLNRYNLKNHITYRHCAEQELNSKFKKHVRKYVLLDRSLSNNESVLCKPQKYFFVFKSLQFSIFHIKKTIKYVRTRHVKTNGTQEVGDVYENTKENLNTCEEMNEEIINKIFSTLKFQCFDYFEDEIDFSKL